MLTINKEKGKIMKKILGLILISIFMSISAKAEWQSMVPSGYVTSTLVKNNTIFATCMGQGVFRSENEGVSWTQLNNGLASTIVTSSCLSGQYIFILTNDGVYRSDNNGDNWQKCNSGLIDTMYIKSICSTDSLLCVLTDRNRIFASNDWGNTWKVRMLGINEHDELYGLYSLGSEIIVSGYDEWQDLRSIYLLSSHKSNWENFYFWNYQSIQCQSNICTYKGNYFIIGSTEDKSNEVLGSSYKHGYYHAIRAGLDSTKSAMALTVSGDRMYLVTDLGSIYSLSIPNNDCLDSNYSNYKWEYLKNISYSQWGIPDFESLVFINDTYFSKTKLGLYKGKISMPESEIVSNGLKYNGILDLVSVQNNLFGCYFPGILYRSSNNGISWNVINLPIDSNFSCSSCYSDKTNLYALIKDKHNYEYFTLKSNDCGQNWERIGSSYYYVRDMFMSSDEILIANKEGLFRMDCDGNSQEKLNYQTSNDAIRSIYKTQNMIFVVTNYGEIYKGMNNGTEWIQIDSNFNDCTVDYKCNTTRIRAIDNIIFAASEEKLLKSEDWGKTWTDITPQFPKIAISSIDVVDNSLYVVLGSLQNGREVVDVIFSDDYGTTWIHDNKGINQDCAISSIYEHNAMIYYNADLAISFKQKPGSSTPKLMYPVNNSDKVDLNERLIWCKMDGVKKYEVNISKNSDFSNGKLQTIDNLTIETEMYYVDKLQLDKNAKYYWRVKGIGDGKHTEWSETSSFTTGETSNVFDDFKEYLISIAPQPADNEAFITFHNSNNINELNVEIYDIKGTLLDNVHFNSLLNGMNNLRLDISKLSTGFYNVIIKSNSETYHTKLIKK